MTIRQRVYQYLDELPAGNISGWKLHDDMYLQTGRRTYPATLLGYLRDYCDASGSDLECIDHQNSIYRYIPGHKIAGALTGSE